MRHLGQQENQMSNQYEPDPQLYYVIQVRQPEKWTCMWVFTWYLCVANINKIMSLERYYHHSFE